MAGTLSSNSTSTTGPITCTTRPTFSVAMYLFLATRRAAAQRRGASSPCYVLRSLRPRSRHHLDDLLRDRRPPPLVIPLRAPPLPPLVHVEGEPVDHAPRVARGRVHGRHARAVLRRRGLQ